MQQQPGEERAKTERSADAGSDAAQRDTHAGGGGEVGVDVAMWMSSSIGWIGWVGWIMVLLPSAYNILLHTLALVGFFSMATSPTTRQLGGELQRAFVTHATALVGHIASRNAAIATQTVTQRQPSTKPTNLQPD